MKNITKVKSTKIKCFGSDKKDDLEEEEEGDKDTKKDTANDHLGRQYNYLLGMPIYSLTYEKVLEIKE